MEERNFPRKSSCGLATDWSLRSRRLMPPGIYTSLTKALFTHDFLHVSFIATLPRTRGFRG